MQSTRECSRLLAYKWNKMRVSGYKCSRLSPLCRWAILILLSASVSSEPRQCYWCGPLAEQVHRSQRVQPCGTGDAAQTTTCDPGYEYCAVVATAPPHVESRYCVKLYQDECYPQFCNSTKTWRMTCPCRGDLCNGPNTDRENEAFAVLKKLATKSTRIIKRDAGMTSNDQSNNNETKLITVNPKPQNKATEIQNAIHVDIKGNVNIDTETSTTRKVEMDNSKNLKLDEMQSDQPMENDKTNAAEKEIKVINAGKDSTENKDTKANLDNLKQQTQKYIVTTTVKTTTDKKIEPYNRTDAMPNDILEPEDQQNKYTTTTVTPTISTKMVETNNTIEPTKSSRNSAVGICLHIILIIKWILIYAYFHK